MNGLSVPPRGVPSHPALASGQKLREQIDSGQMLPRNLGTPPPEYHVNPPDGYRPVSEVPPAPTEEAVPAVAPAEDGLPDVQYVAPPVETAPAVAPPVAPAPAPMVDPATLDLQRQLVEEREARNQLMKQLAQVEQERQAAALAAEVQFSDDELSIMDPNDARLVAARAAQAAQARSQAEMVALRDQLREEWKREFDAKQATAAAESAQEAERQRFRSTNAVLLQAVPDLARLIETPTYKNYVAQPVEGGRLRQSVIQDAFREGNTDYIIKVLNKVKSAMPDYQAVERVMPNTPGAAVAKPAASREDKLNEDSAMLRRAITGTREDKEAYRQWYKSRLAGSASQPSQ